MWGMSFAIFGVCKLISVWGISRDGVSVRQQLAYWLAWPGLDARAFWHGRNVLPVGPQERLLAWVKMLGVGLMPLLLVWPRLEGLPTLWRGWLGMVALIFVLHFGLFHLLSCAWRARGVEAKPLMRMPIKATSLGAFWGQRWNTAFRDLTHRSMFKPLRRKVGSAGAVLMVYAFSGIVHDVVISIPAGGGYGRPTLYFLIQGGGFLLERHRGWHHWIRLPAIGWMWTFAVVALPAPILLFHEPFVEKVMVPFFEAVTL